MATETEIKFRVTSLAKLEHLLEASGFHLVTPRTFECNTLYDTPDRSLRARTQILRIRQYGEKWVVTHKCLPKQLPGEDRHKNREETETEVADGNVMGEIFSNLGFRPAFRYEKFRTEWADSSGHCVIDETPIGLFAELEGPASWIDQIARQLEVSPDDFITLSYGRLFEVWREQTGSTANDLTFDAIKPLNQTR